VQEQNGRITFLLAKPRREEDRARERKELGPKGHYDTELHPDPQKLKKNTGQVPNGSVPKFPQTFPSLWERQINQLEVTGIYHLSSAPKR
jgi:hypothetical protein